MVDNMPIAILLIVLIISGAFCTQVLIFIPLSLPDLFHIPTWFLLTFTLIFLSWFLAE